MGKRTPCEDSEYWRILFGGDCSQHLKLDECPAVSGISTDSSEFFQGAPYYTKPTAIISGEMGGPLATGFIGYGVLDSRGFVTGLQIESSGWHYIYRPLIIFSGNFKERVKISDGKEHYECYGKNWDDKNCMCSGMGLIRGYPLYENVTKVPPQCSPIYELDDWTTGYKNLRDCNSTELAYAKTSDLGRCLMPTAEGSDSGRCITTWASGWTTDCSNGVWRKTANYCGEKGSYAPYKKCKGDWYMGGVTPDCGNEIEQEWNKTTEYLDVGVCKKRGYKNAVAMKAWHGEIPFNLAPICDGDGNHLCSDGELQYSTKYLTARGTWKYDMTWDNPAVDRYGSAHGRLTVNSSVDRHSSKVSASQDYSYNSTNWHDTLECGSLVGIDRCSTGLFGYTGQQSEPWNYSINLESEEGHSQTSITVKTTKSITSTGYIYTQETTSSSYLEACIMDQGYCTEVYEVVHDFKFYSKETITVDLSNPYTSTELNSDVDELLDQWDLLNDAQYPWKISESEFLMPKITRCEAGPTSPLLGLYGDTDVSCPGDPTCTYQFSFKDATVTWDDCTPMPDFPLPPDSGSQTGNQNGGALSMSCRRSIHPATCRFNCRQDGRILGGPAEYGHIGTVDFTHENREDLCCSCNCETYNNLITRSFGAQSPYYHFTQWPNDHEIPALFFGAFSLINDTAAAGYACSSNNLTSYPIIDVDVIVKGKYAEIIQMEKPSRNFALPCGIGSSGELVYFNNGDSSVLSLASNDYKTDCVETCDCSTIDAGGGKNCYACSGGNDFKNRWTGTIGNSGSACFTGGILRIASGLSTTTGVSLVLIGIHSGQVGDYVNADIGIGSPKTYYPGTYPITTIDSTSGFTITGNFTESNDVTGWVDFPTGYDWFDNYPKGDFIVRYWNYPSFTGTAPTVPNWPSPRADMTIYQYCLPYTPCDPAIVVITTDGGVETSHTPSRNAKIIEMPSLSPKLCGAKFHYLPQQWMVDPLWQKYSMPCCLLSGSDRPECQPDLTDSEEIYDSAIHYWSEDDGTCTLSQEEYEFSPNGSLTKKVYHYYPMRPFVEARAYLPNPVAGQPDLPMPPNTRCSFPHSILSVTGACYSKDLVAGLSESVANYLVYYYGDALCPICAPPSYGVTYWGTFAPWKVSTNQEACINEAYPLDLS